MPEEKKVSLPAQKLKAIRTLITALDKLPNDDARREVLEFVHVPDPLDTFGK